ncbi:hypothetical protein EVAR_40088_1 [Eumeta japonica]|uniref:Uncharacterized protein n=1 Tax=Eumeta variegata TaxID=151549 RepID=A0A4C1X5E3_EUMVA|nr:hypothetical protein EVAR_40088_1 [Eumeta japonica]
MRQLSNKPILPPPNKSWKNRRRDSPEKKLSPELLARDCLPIELDNKGRGFKTVVCKLFWSVELSILEPCVAWQKGGGGGGCAFL